jgi:RNA polymerase sigma-70 factor, ECF subfamily
LPDDVPDLVRRSLSGDQTAMASLIERFRGQVFGLCYRMLGQRQDAEDMTQESFVRAFRSLKGWDCRREFRPWLLAIASNRCRSFLATRARLPKPTAEWDHVADGRPDPRESRDVAEEVRLALGSLREEYRQALVLFHEQQMNYAEIGEVLGCPEGTVKTWVHRARRELADYVRRRGVIEEATRAVR